MITEKNEKDLKKILCKYCEAEFAITAASEIVEYLSIVKDTKCSTECKLNRFNYCIGQHLFCKDRIVL